jgi:3-mercaptopyruvate sulfurtransferase SseA
VVHELKERGFVDVYPLRGGFKAWQKAGLPVEPVQDNNAEGILTHSGVQAR